MRSAPILPSLSLSHRCGRSFSRLSLVFLSARYSLGRGLCGASAGCGQGKVRSFFFAAFILHRHARCVRKIIGGAQGKDAKRIKCSAVISDVDGTLVTNEKVPTERTKAAAAALRGKWNTFFNYQQPTTGWLAHVDRTPRHYRADCRLASQAHR